MSTQSQNPLQPSKIRASCDACGQAKVRCDRGRPACTRCAAQGTNCVYGVSRKGGKPPRRRTSPTALASHLTEPESTPVDMTSGGHDDIDMMLNLADDALAFDYPFFASDAHFSLGALTSLSSDPDTWMSGSGPTSLKPAESSTTISTTVASASAPDIRPCCISESKDIMRWLYCANPSTVVSDGVPARTLDLDSVLIRNRDIIPRLRRLLNCPCARSPHMAMLYASIVSRVLLWYRQAVWKTSPTGASSLSSSSPMPATPETTPLSSTSATLRPFEAEVADENRDVSVLPTPIMIGTFRSDDANLQTAFTNCLVRSELKRVSGLIDSFISLGTCTSDLQTAADACPAARETSASSNLADASLFASLGAWLRTEHERIVIKARAATSMLEDNLSFD